MVHSYKFKLQTSRSMSFFFYIFHNVVVKHVNQILEALISNKDTVLISCDNNK